VAQQEEEMKTTVEVVTGCGGGLARERGVKRLRTKRQWIGMSGRGYLRWSKAFLDCSAKE
jgi:hypothetical protein